MNATSRDITNVRLRTALELIAAENGGVLSPRQVVDVARAPSHILHDAFEWDDTSAAEQYRIAQARGLIRRVKLHIVRPATKTREAHLLTARAYQSRPSMRHEHGGYEPVDAILGDAHKRSELLAQVLSELTAYRRRYSQLTELQGIWSAIDESIVELDVEPVDRPAPAVDSSSHGAAGI